MANNQFAATRYGEVTTFDGKNGGWQLQGNGYAGPVYDSWPVVGTRVIGVSPAQTITTLFGTVTVNSIIEVFPMGLTVPGFTKKYICDATVATLATART